MAKSWDDHIVLFLLILLGFFVLKKLKLKNKTKQHFSSSSTKESLLVNNL